MHQEMKIKMKKWAIMVAATLVFATTACGPQGSQEATSTDSIGFCTSNVIDEATAARLLGHSAAGMRYVLKIEDGGDTITLRGTIEGRQGGGK